MARTIRDFQGLVSCNIRRRKRNNAVKGEVRHKSISSDFDLDHDFKRRLWTSGGFEDHFQWKYSETVKADDEPTFIYQGKELPKSVLQYLIDKYRYSRYWCINGAPDPVYDIEITHYYDFIHYISFPPMTYSRKGKHLAKKKRRNERREARRLKESSLDSFPPSPEGGGRRKSYHREYSVTLGDPAGICQIYTFVYRNLHLHETTDDTSRFYRSDSIHSNQ